MANTILTDHQINFLTVFGGTPKISKKFYLTGGTALAGFYIPYRYSEDLDFFSETEIDVMEIQTFLKANKTKLAISETEYQNSFNRNLFFLKLADGTTLKTEFTYFPFTPFEKGQPHYKVTVDSALDIAVNKLFTIYQRTAARDYLDLYQLCQKFKYSIPDLIAKARLKFDSHIDLLKLGTQFSKAPEAADLPKMILPVPEKGWHDFFISESKKLQPEILK